MHQVPAPAVRLMKRRVFSRPGVKSLQDDRKERNIAIKYLTVKDNHFLPFLSWTSFVKLINFQIEIILIMKKRNIKEKRMN